MREVIHLRLRNNLRLTLSEANFPSLFIQLPEDENRFVHSHSHPFFRDKFCPEHTHDGMARCCACARFEPRDVPYVALSDRRRICQECHSSVLVDKADCQVTSPALHKSAAFEMMRYDPQQCGGTSTGGGSASSVAPQGLSLVRQFLWRLVGYIETQIPE